jgi:hypothetical protein
MAAGSIPASRSNTAFQPIEKTAFVSELIVWQARS